VFSHETSQLNSVAGLNWDCDPVPAEFWVAAAGNVEQLNSEVLMRLYPPPEFSSLMNEVG
jgi:hypothetical protein